MIYYDLTSCLDYIGRNPLGIVRVEMKFAEYAIRHLGSEKITFCYYDRPSGTIRNLALQDAQWVLSQIGRPADPPPAAAVPSPSASPADPPPVPSTPFKTRVKHVLKALAGSLTTEFGDSRLVRGCLTRAESWYYARKRSREQAASLPPSAQPPAAPACPAEEFMPPWTAQDVFVTVGLVWDYLPLDRIYGWKKRLGFKVVGMIYDLIPYQVPEYCAGVPPSFFRAVADLIWCSDTILAISQQTKRDIESFIAEYQLPHPPTIEVAYLGMDVGRLNEGYVPLRTEIDVSRLEKGRFVLQVGTMEARKNHALSVNVWRLLSKEPFPELMPLVVVGAQGWGVGDILETARRDIRLSPRYFIHSNRVSDQTLLWLYANCYMTIYPSFYEGWGLPVAESLANGKLCLSGDNGALLEAGGGFSETLSPFDVCAWARRLKELMLHPEDVEARNRRIAAEFRPATWDERSAEFFDWVEKTLEVRA